MFIHNILTAYPGRVSDDDGYVYIFSLRGKNRDYLNRYNISL